MCNRLVI